MAEVGASKVWRRPLNDRRRPIGEGHGRCSVPDEIVEQARAWAAAERIGWRQMYARWRERHPLGPRPAARWLQDVLSYRRRAQHAPTHTHTSTPTLIQLGRMARDACADLGQVSLRSCVTCAAAGTATLRVDTARGPVVVVIDCGALGLSADPIALLAGWIEQQMRMVAITPQHNNLER